MEKQPDKIDHSLFWEELQPGQIIFELMDMLVDTLVYVKGRDGSYIYINKVFTSTLLSDNKSILGKTDEELFGAELARQYMADDQAVIRDEKRIAEKAELVTYRPGVVKWYLTTKVPLYSKSGVVVGIAGISRPSKAHLNSDHTGPMSSLSKAVDYIYENKYNIISVDMISAASGISISTLERSFKKYFNCSPGKFVTQVKVSTACELLGEPSFSINEVCYQMGYSDPVVFTRIFKREMKVTPSNYRKSLHQNT